MASRKEFLIGLVAAVPALGALIASPDDADARRRHKRRHKHHGHKRRRRRRGGSVTPVPQCVALPSAGDLCATCNGNGNCDSNSCVGGVCTPQSNPCIGLSPRTAFACAGATATCCLL